MNWCLIPEYVDKFRKGIEDGSISPEKLISMESIERRKYLSKFVGDFNAKYINAEFESKLLLKNQQRGIITWASKAIGISKTAKADIIDRAMKLTEPLKNESQFSDIIERRLGVQVSKEQAEQIVSFTSKMQELYDVKKSRWEQQRPYYEEKQKLLKYLREISPENTVTTRSGIIRSKIASVLSVQRALKTGFDISAALRQGRAYFGSKEWNRAAKNMFKYAKDPNAMDQLEVDIMTSKYAEHILQNKRELGLTLLGETFTQREEQFASKLVDKIPYLRGSERAYTGFLNDLRFRRFEKILSNLDKAGNGITNNPIAMNDLAKVIGASTGRGTLGSAEGAARSLATVLFSPRWLASRFEMIFNPLTKKGPARIEALKSLGGLIGTTVMIAGMLKMAGSNIEFDSRSSKFLQIKIGKTYFDISGGLAPVIVLLSRIATFSSKSSNTEIVRKLNEGTYGTPTTLDTLFNFFTNKTAPVASIFRDLLKGENFEGEPVKIDITSLKSNKDFAKYVADQLIIPLLISDVVNSFTNSSGGVIDAILSGKSFKENISGGIVSVPASLIGIGVSSDSQTDVDWEQSTSKDIMQFKEEVGDNKFIEANDEFNERFLDWISKVKEDPLYQKLSSDDKQTIITRTRTQLKQDIFKKYGFKPTKVISSPLPVLLKP